ncbi:hypothetical protein [Streptomyces sp. NPDC096351]|uniref:hypothetical protein n=1 Tax=Streptomyces sp. NPDC096351 TaxID=3366087 RepID=UPI0037FD73CB
MSLATLTTTITGGNDPAYYAGRADAYDEHNHGATLNELTTRAAHITDHHDPMYAAGYNAHVLELRRETAFRTATEADIAHHLQARAA